MHGVEQGKIQRLYQRITYCYIKNHKIEEYEGNYSRYLQYEKEKLKKQKNNNENDRLLLEFKLSQISSELSITKDEKRKTELEEEFNRLIKLKHLTNQRKINIMLIGNKERSIRYTY